MYLILFIYTHLTWQELHMRLLHQANLLLVLGLVGCKTVGYLELINVECQSYSSYTIGTSYIVNIDYLSDQNCVNEEN